MKNERDRGICCVLAILVLFSGMCLEYAKTDSLFASVRNIGSASYMGSYDREMTCCEFSTAEMSGVRNTAYVTNNLRRYSQRSVLRLSMLLIFAGFLLPKVSNMQVMAEMIGAPETPYVTALLHYIHSQDGKK